LGGGAVNHSRRLIGSRGPVTFFEEKRETPVDKLIVQIVVLGIVTAINPVPIGAAIVLLAARHGKRNAFIFTLSMAAVLYGIGSWMLEVPSADGNSTSSTASNGSAIFTLLIGVAFLAVFLQQWRRDPGTPGEQPGWMKSVEKLGIVAPLVMAVALTNYALLSAAVTDILKADVSTTQAFAALGLFVVLAIMSALMPLLLTIISPRWASKQLGRLSAWLAFHDRALLMWVFGIMGGVFAVQGIVQLL
jgi:putative Mn2+ efflux pump MntP